MVFSDITSCTKYTTTTVVDYAASLHPALLVVKDELWQMLNEALALADTTNENIAPAVKRGPPQRHTRDHNNVTNVVPEAFDIRNSLCGICRQAASGCHFHTVWCRMPRSYIRVIAVYFESLDCQRGRRCCIRYKQRSLTKPACPRIYYTAEA